MKGNICAPGKARQEGRSFDDDHAGRPGSSTISRTTRMKRLLRYRGCVRRAVAVSRSPCSTSMGLPCMCLNFRGSVALEASIAGGMLVNMQQHGRQYSLSLSLSVFPTALDGCLGVPLTLTCRVSQYQRIGRKPAKNGACQRVARCFPLATGSIDVPRCISCGR